MSYDALCTHARIYYDNHYHVTGLQTAGIYVIKSLQIIDWSSVQMRENIILLNCNLTPAFNIFGSKILYIVLLFRAGIMIILEVVLRVSFIVLNNTQLSDILFPLGYTLQTTIYDIEVS